MQNKSKTFVIVIVIILLVVASYVAFVRKALKDINSVATEDKISTTDDDAIAAKKTFGIRQNSAGKNRCPRYDIHCKKKIKHLQSKAMQKILSW